MRESTNAGEKRGEKRRFIKGGKEKEVSQA